MKSGFSFTVWEFEAVLVLGQMTTSYPRPCFYHIFIPQTTESYPYIKNDSVICQK